MEWTEKLQKIIDYVEHHLQRQEEPIDYNEIVQIAKCNFTFFQKVFSYTTGISFADYVRARKMTLAGYDLKSTNMKVIDISYKYGYDSPTSFSKAFVQFHGVCPKKAREHNVELRIYPKMQVFHQQSYSWSIITTPQKRLVGQSIHVSCLETVQKLPAFWNECQRNGLFSQMIAIDQGHPKGLYGVIDYHHQTREIDYFIAVESDLPINDDFSEIIIPKMTWAVFDCYGPVPQAIQDGWTYLNQEWLVKYPFLHAHCPEIEWYSSNNSFASDYLSQIWIPIIKEEEK